MSYTVMYHNVHIACSFNNYYALQIRAHKLDREEMEIQAAMQPPIKWKLSSKPIETVWSMNDSLVWFKCCHLVSYLRHMSRILGKDANIWHLVWECDKLLSIIGMWSNLIRIWSLSNNLCTPARWNHRKHLVSVSYQTNSSWHWPDMRSRWICFG